ncbi:unnamed protein product [Sphagnum jensenii]|uniref:Endoglucanase n=1 Tax=Sphagnum jensenii TaxID=128206 RepID=A0ABP1BIC1_9BRYO
MCSRLTRLLVLIAALVCTGSLRMVAAFTAADYATALRLSILFYDVQRSGVLPNWQRVRWRGNSAIYDGTQSNARLSGGYYDAGDNMKFGFPMAFSMTLLSWSAVDFREELKQAGQLGHTLNAIRWGTDYLLKAYTAPNELWIQVGDPNSDHACWERPEDMDTPRPAFQVNTNRPGSDVAAETAAALAAASLAFRNLDSIYSARLLTSAIQVFNFANNYRGKYSDSFGGVVCPFYCSYSGYNDELVWGAAWLYKATRDVTYLQYLISNGATLGGTTESVNSFDWDNKYAGAQVLLSAFVLGENDGGLHGYKARADNFICSILPRSVSPVTQTAFTPGGLLFRSGQSNLQYVTTAAFLATVYGNYLSNSRSTVSCGGAIITPLQLASFAKSQVDYILGANRLGMSYMVGFGPKYPQQVHHRAASLPSKRVYPGMIYCQQGFSWFQTAKPNPNQATGAVIGGPDQSDNLNDVRSNYAQMEPTTYINAPLVGVLASLAEGSKGYK